MTMYIEPTNTRSIKPVISIRDISGKQRCIAFGKLASEKFFKNKTHVAIEIDYKKKQMSFVPCVEAFKNKKGFKLINDGGRAKTKCIYFGASQLKAVEKIPSGQYNVIGDEKLTINF